MDCKGNANSGRGNRIARAVRDASDSELGDFTRELLKTLDMDDGANDVLEEALIETSECVDHSEARQRGAWTMMSGLWHWPEEALPNGVVLPEIFTVANCESMETRGRRMAPQTIDWISADKKLLVEVSLMSSKAACDAWVACFQLMGGGRNRGGTRSLTPDGWVAVTWSEDVQSCLMYLERAFPDTPVIRSMLDEEGNSLIEVDVGGMDVLTSSLH